MICLYVNCCVSLSGFYISGLHNIQSLRLQQFHNNFGLRARIKSQVFLMLHVGYFTLRTTLVSCDFVVHFSATSKYKIYLRCNFIRSGYQIHLMSCKTQLHKNPLWKNISGGIENPLYAPGLERKASVYITNDTPLNSHLPTFQLDATAVWRMNYYM